MVIARVTIMTIRDFARAYQRDASALIKFMKRHGIEMKKKIRISGRGQKCWVIEGEALEKARSLMKEIGHKEPRVRSRKENES